MMPESAEAHHMVAPASFDTEVWGKPHPQESQTLEQSKRGPNKEKSQTQFPSLKLEHPNTLTPKNRTKP